MVCCALLAPAGAAEPDVRTPSTVRMVELLEGIADARDPRQDPFLNDARLALIDQVPEPSGGKAARYLFIVGQESVLAGESARAVVAFERLRALLDSGAAAADATSRRSIDELAALAYLRRGEQENCLAGHNVDRCLLPIRGRGVHDLKAGSKGAIAIYTELLDRGTEAVGPGTSLLGLRWLLNLAYMTIGEHPDKVPRRYLIPAEAFRSEAPMPRFYDRAPALGLDVFGLAGGCITEDFDNDGFVDIAASSWGLLDQLELFANGGDGTFSKRTASAGLTGITGGLNLAHADFDNDGLVDILVLRGAWLRDAGRHPNSLLKNLGGMRFSDVTAAAGLLSLHPTQVGQWADYDLDGDLDLFVGNETMAGSTHRAELFHNLGNGRFEEVAAAVGMVVEVPVKGAAWGDIDNDRLPDLYVSNNNGRNLLFHNLGAAADGAWRFEEIAARAGVGEPRVSFPTWFWDFDNDGWEDLFVANYVGSLGDLAAEYLGRTIGPELRPRLYRNNGDLTFTDVSGEVGLSRIIVAMGANFGDVDNDGWLDIYAGTGNTQMQTLMPNRLFRNQGGERFLDVTSAVGVGHLQKGHGIAFADLDHDGDQDIYAVMGGSHSGDGFHNALFENPGSDNHWITLELEGKTANRSAIGARVEVEVSGPSGARSLYRTVGGGGSFGASTLRLELGLGAATELKEVIVTWPDKSPPQSIRGLEPDRFYRIVQGREGAETLERHRFALGGRSRHEPHH